MGAFTRVWADFLSEGRVMSVNPMGKKWDNAIPLFQTLVPWIKPSINEGLRKSFNGSFMASACCGIKLSADRPGTAFTSMM